MSESFIYVIESESGYLKIGVAKRPYARLTELQTGSWESLRIKTTWPGNFFDEQDIHARFDHLRVRGEWFRPTRELKDFIQEASGQNYLIFPPIKEEMTLADKLHTKSWFITALLLFLVFQGMILQYAISLGIEHYNKGIHP